mgnify:FL=1
MPLDSLLDQHPRHVADRARLLISQGRQTVAEILWQDHLNPRGFGLPAGGRLTGGHNRISRGSLSYSKVYRGGQG